jgi:signal transduction histidine kinase
LTLRRHLLLLTLVAVLPVLLIGSLLGAMLVVQERRTFENGARDRVRAISTGVDAALRGTITTVLAVAASPSLHTGDLGAFHAELRAVLASQPDWLSIVLLSTDGRQLVNANLPFGAALPRTVDEASLSAVVRSHRTAVGDLSMGPVLKRYGVTVRVPVLREGRVAYVISAVVKPESIQALLERERVPERWAVGIADRNRLFVARQPATAPGTPVAPGFRAALESRGEGEFRATTLEGVDTFQWFTTTPLSGWAVGLAVPADVVLRGARRAGAFAAIGVLAAMLLSLFAAYFVARRISTPLVSLADAAHAIARGSAAPPRADTIEEVKTVAAALERAGIAVQEREADLRAANRSKDEFLAALSHELRNPLAAISMSPHILRHSAGDKAAIEQTANMLERQSRQLSALVDQLLEISRVTLGKLELARQPVELEALARRVVDTWRAAGRLEKHAVTVHGEPAWIHGDPVRLEQILSNLLDNSLKFTPPDGRVEVSVRKTGAEVALTVADTGRGFEPGGIERMFGVFVQGEQTIERPTGGIGVGLALVRRLVELHGGRIRAESAGEGRGAVFTVTFPAMDLTG